MQRMAFAFGRVYLFAACLRSVSEENKTLALGIRSMCGTDGERERDRERERERDYSLHQ